MAEQQKWINDQKYVDKYQSTYGSTTEQLKVITQFFQAWLITLNIIKLCNNFIRSIERSFQFLKWLLLES